MGFLSRNKYLIVALLLSGCASLVPMRQEWFSDYRYPSGLVVVHVEKVTERVYLLTAKGEQKLEEEAVLESWHDVANKIASSYPGINDYIGKPTIDEYFYSPGYLIVKSRGGRPRSGIVVSGEIKIIDTASNHIPVSKGK